MKVLEFFFDGDSVGIFLQIPESNGIYEYEPFRGIGHYEMATTIKSKGFANCYFYNENQKYNFKAEYDERTSKSKSRVHTLKVTELILNNR